MATSGQAAQGAVPQQLGKYSVLRRLATGGMAQIFLGFSQGVEGFRKLVVLKRILPALAENPDIIEMFRDEARVAATLSHSNIVQVYDFGADAGEYFLAMEFLHGQDLSQVMKRAATTGGAIALDEAIAITAGVCAGLHYAHEVAGKDGRPLGIVHRDVSPHNVLVTFDGGVKLMDFGIAKTAAKVARTRSGGLKGKVNYMSPEQCWSNPVDRRG